MAYNYDLEAALQKTPPAIEAVSAFTEQRIPAVIDSVQDLAKMVNADKLTKVVNSLCDAVTASQTMYREVLGAEGDTMHDGTLYGELKGAKDMDSAMNG